MAHYKETEKGQGLFLTVNLSEQLVPGTFEHTLKWARTGDRHPIFLHL
jgi:hypothetical protein